MTRFRYPYQIPGQEEEVVVSPLALAGSDPFPPVPRGHVGFHPDDGFDPLFAGIFLEGPGSEKAPVVGECQSRHFEFLCPPDQVRDPVRSVQEGVFGVGV